MNVGYLQRRASREQCAAYVWGPLTPARDDARNARSDNQTANNINKTSTSPLQCPQMSVKQSLDALHFIVNISTEFVIHLSLSLQNLYYTLTLIKTATASCSNNNKKKQAHRDSSRSSPSRAGGRASRRRLFGLCGLCGQRHDDVCTPAMAPG